jgi:hypothetical protein
MALTIIPTVVASANASMNELKITASGNWTAPTGVNKVWLHMIGGGGGGAVRGVNGLMGGGSAGEIVYQQVTVSSGTTYTATIGAGGAPAGSGSATTIFGLTAAGGFTGQINYGGGYQKALGHGVSIGLQGAVPAPSVFGTSSSPANTGIPGQGRYSSGTGFSGGSGVIIIKWLS